MKPGVYEDLSYEQYAAIKAYRSHDLTSAIRCPFQWKFAPPLSESPALLEGRVQHTVFLELHKFDEEFAIIPDVDRRTKAGKEEYEDWLSTVDGRTPIKRELYEVCMARREIVAEYVPKPEHRAELTVVFEWLGYPFKARFDWYTGTDIWDLKTCRDASPRGFRSAINAFRYHQQAALYLRAAERVGLPAAKFYFLAQEKQAPYPYGVYTLSDEAIAYAESKNEQALATILEAEKSGIYLPYGVEGTTEIGIDELW